MKVLKKALKTQLALLLALLLTLALGTTAFAVSSPYRITVMNRNNSISMAGNTYNAYKLFDVTYSGDNYAYTVTDEFASFEYTVDGKSYKGESLINYLGTLQDDSEALDTFAKAALKYVTDANTDDDANNDISLAGTVEVKENDATQQATITVFSAGYYLVAGSATAAGDQTVVAACALTTTHPTAEVIVKADAPSIEKKIVGKDENNNDKLVDANTASIGDTVTYQLSSSVPNMKGYEKYFFVMNDTLSKGLTYNGDNTMTVKMRDKTLAKDTDYTVESSTDATTGKTTITIVFKNFIQYKGQAGTAITVTYSATLNEKASLSAADGNPNTVTLTYSNNPNVQGTGTPGNPDKPGEKDVTGETPGSEVKTYVTGIKINKVDGKDNKKLAGAKFAIKGNTLKVVLTKTNTYEESESGTYYKLRDGSYTSDRPTEETEENYASTTQKYKMNTIVDKTTVSDEIKAEGYTGDDGILIFEGLNAGTYTITELVAPDGYNLLKNPITVTITENANMTNANWTVKEKVDGGTESTLQVGSDNLFSFNVENNSGSELPSTGGMGTTIFYVLGSLLVVIAGVALVTKKRMSKTEE